MGIPYAAGKHDRSRIRIGPNSCMSFENEKFISVLFIITGLRIDDFVLTAGLRVANLIL